MLQNDFFNFNVPQIEGNTAVTTLHINAGHRIFEGHFPGQPVVPGVCMMQMVKEVLENVTGVKLRLVKAGDMKFLAVIDPNKNGIVELEIKFTAYDDQITTEAKIYNAGGIFFKFKGLFGNKI